MRIPQRLVWSEGMFMSPQHLQALDRCHEALLASRLDSLASNNWGSLYVEVDTAALGAGQLRLQRFAGILPDGTPIAFEENEPEAPPPRPVAEHFPPTARSLEVYLAVPRDREGVPSFAEDASQARNRFFIASRPMEDATMLGASVSVAFARPNVTLMFGDEAREDYDTMVIAELVRGSSGQIELAENYIPPCLRISASPYLVGGVRDVLTQMIAKQRQLAEGRRERDSTSADISAPEVTRLMQLLSLNGSIPAMAHLAETADFSPQSAYLLLSQLAGQLSTFQPGADPTALPKFNYNDLRSTFQDLFFRLKGLLGGLALAQYITLPLEMRGTGLYMAIVQDDRILRTTQLILTVKSELPEQQVIDQLPKLAKIASSVDIQGLMHAVVSGLPLQVAHRPPPQIPIRPGMIYFGLNTANNQYWQNVLADRKIAIYLPPPYDASRTRIELLAVPLAGGSLPPGSAPPTGRPSPTGLPTAMGQPTIPGRGPMR